MVGKEWGSALPFSMPREIKRKVTKDCIPQVCDFADVFPDELPGLPPHRDGFLHRFVSRYRSYFSSSIPDGSS